MEQGDAQKITYVLEMTTPYQLRRPAGVRELEVQRLEVPCPEFSWFLHEAVGADYRWGGREHWGRRAWTEFVQRPELETWVAYSAGNPVGYYELENQDDGSVRIACFGLLRQFTGQGLGGYLLVRAVERCWEKGAERVWLRTCSHDHPHALSNYCARGFRIVATQADPANAPRASTLFRQP